MSDGSPGTFSFRRDTSGSEYKEGYKVVRRRKPSGLYTSALVWGMSDLLVVYRPNEWTEPQQKPATQWLTVFDNHDDAYEFADGLDWDMIEVHLFTCRYERIEKERPPTRYAINYNGRILPEHVWHSWPKGTDFARRVRFIERTCSGIQTI